MKIGIDACCWSNRRGFGRYTRELLTHMLAARPDHEYTLVVDAATAREWELPRRARLVVVETREQPTRAASASGARSLADLWRLSRAASRLPVDVFFFPAVYSFYPLLRRVPTVVTFHDTIAEDHPELVFAGSRAHLFWRLKTWLAWRQATRLLTVSESARAQIARTFRCPAASIAVVPEGVASEFRPLDDPAAARAACVRHGLPADRPLVLYVGGISPHKNLLALLDAFARVRLLLSCHLALVGDYRDDAFLGCHPELVERRRLLGLEADVSFTGFVPDADLVALYGAASLVVLPSCAEGFGLPALEAMACAAPVAASRRGSLPEVLGPAGTYFEPDDRDGMASVIRALLEDPALRERSRQEGLRQARRFSWQSAAQETIRILEEAARAS